jgi:hypothetical protein
VAHALTRTWYRVALARPDDASPKVFAVAGAHMGVAVAAAERHVEGSFAVAAEVADNSEIPLGESLGKSSVVELGPAAEVPVFRWPVGVLPKLSRAAAAAGARRGFTRRANAELLVIEAQTTAEHLTDLFLGMIERLPSADNLEVRLLDHFEDAGRADVWLTSRVDGHRILRFLDDHDEELLGNGHLELSVYVRAHRATLRLTEHKTVVWLSADGALEADVMRWLGELTVPHVDALVTVKDAPAKSRDRKKLGEELYRQRLRRVDTVRPTG